jgi:hypothetical protein
MYSFHERMGKEPLVLSALRAYTKEVCRFALICKIWRKWRAGNVGKQDDKRECNLDCQHACTKLPLVMLLGNALNSKNQLCKLETTQ